jgi:uncharacterized protein
MAIGPDRRYMTAAQADAAQIDVGLRQYMLRVYQYMAGGLALTGAVALYVANSPAALNAIFGTPLAWVVMLAPLGFALMFGFRIHKMTAGTAQMLFWAFAAVMGLSLSLIFVRFTGESIARTFFITGGTKRDLSGFGSFLFMGLIGLILASVVNIFLGSTALQFAISVIGVLVFTGLTAYDTQRIKEMYAEYDAADVGVKKAILGAFMLYLDFINLFVYMLQFLGVARSE